MSEAPMEYDRDESRRGARAVRHADRLAALTAPTSAAGATKPNELTSPPEPAPSRASGLLPVAREGLSDEQIKARCKAAGIQWIEPMLDDEGDGYPGGFDMTSMEAMRALLAPASGDAPGEAK